MFASVLCKTVGKLTTLVQYTLCISVVCLSFLRYKKLFTFCRAAIRDIKKTKQSEYNMKAELDIKLTLRKIDNFQNIAKNRLFKKIGKYLKKMAKKLTFFQKICKKLTFFFKNNCQ